jgi:hypothetical protein
VDRQEIFRLIEEERERQEKLHPMPTLKKNTGDDLEVMHNFIASTEFLAVLMEEVGEVGKAMQGEGVLKDELVQVAAFCFRWLEYMK